MRGYKLNGVYNLNSPFWNKEYLKSGYFFMELSEEEAKLINMLDIGAIVETHDKRFGTSFAKSLQPLESRISRAAETKQVIKKRSKSEKKISSNKEVKAYEVNDSQNSLQFITKLNDGGSSVEKSSTSGKMKAMVANLVDSSKTSGSVKKKVELESDRVSTLNEEIFEGTTLLISDIQFRQKHNEFIIGCLDEYDETTIKN